MLAYTKHARPESKCQKGCFHNDYDHLRAYVCTSYNTTTGISFTTTYLHDIDEVRAQDEHKLAGKPLLPPFELDLHNLHLQQKLFHLIPCISEHEQSLSLFSAFIIRESYNLMQEIGQCVSKNNRHLISQDQRICNTNF